METSELIGMAIVAVALLILTAQTAYALGHRFGANTERLLANRRVNGVLEYESARKPKSQRAKRKRARHATMRRIGSVTLPSLEVRA